MASTTCISTSATTAPARVGGFIEQTVADVRGLKIAGWAVRLSDGAPPADIKVRWGRHEERLLPTKLRADVAQAHNLPAQRCGFETIIPVAFDVSAEWPDLEVTAEWADSQQLLLPMLKAASDGFGHARKQLVYQNGVATGAVVSPELIGELTKQEADKYRKMYQHAGYRANPGAPHEARDFLARYGLKANDTIIDFGSGPGYASNYFHEQGLRVIAIDIAPNAMRDEFLGKFPLIVAAFWDLPAKLDGEWGFCTDVMEHIPPDRIDDVLCVIRSSVRRSVLFNISLRHDGCGSAIGEVLHLSVFPRSWWEQTLLRFWEHCEFVRGEDNDFACFIVSTPRQP